MNTFLITALLLVHISYPMSFVSETDLSADTFPTEQALKPGQTSQHAFRPENADFKQTLLWQAAGAVAKTTCSRPRLYVATEELIHAIIPLGNFLPHGNSIGH